MATELRAAAARLHDGVDQWPQISHALNALQLPDAFSDALLAGAANALRARPHEGYGLAEVDAMEGLLSDCFDCRALECAAKEATAAFVAATHEKLRGAAARGESIQAAPRGTGHVQSAPSKEQLRHLLDLNRSLWTTVQDRGVASASFVPKVFAAEGRGHANALRSLTRKLCLPPPPESDAIAAWRQWANGSDTAEGAVALSLRGLAAQGVTMVNGQWVGLGDTVPLEMRSRSLREAERFALFKAGADIGQVDAMLTNDLRPPHGRAATGDAALRPRCPHA